MNTDNLASRFALTRWTLVLRARGESKEAQAALSELCEAYYQPVLRFLRREGRDEDAARELTQEFFARVLARGGFQKADPERGRFRSYLLGALKHFLSDHKDYERRLKRGGNAATVTVSDLSDDPEPCCELSDTDGPPPDAWFDREWALAVMNRSLELLAAEFRADGKTAQFQALKPWLIGEAPTLSQSEAAVRLGLSEGAIKVAIHRLRRRFGEFVKAELAQTLPRPEDIQDELRHLIAALT